MRDGGRGRRESRERREREQLSRPHDRLNGAIYAALRAREREAGDNKDDAAHGVLRSGFHDRPARARRAPRSHHLSGFVSVWLPSDGAQGGGVTGVLLPARAAQEEAAVRRASSWTRASSAWVRCCASAAARSARKREDKQSRFRVLPPADV